jgi:hypothetical protein
MGVVWGEPSRGSLRVVLLRECSSLIWLHDIDKVIRPVDEGGGVSSGRRVAHIELIVFQ